MTKARDIADFKFENIVDTGTEGTKVALGTTAQRGSTQGQFRFNSTTGKFEGRNATDFISIEVSPSVTSVNNANPTETEIAGGFDLVITGSNFANGDSVSFIGNDNTEYSSPTVTFNSSSQITARIPTSIDASKEPFKVRVANSGGLQGELASAFNINQLPTWTTASGTIGGGFQGDNINLTVSASDPEGATISYSETTSVLSGIGTGFTLNSSTGAITGTLPNVGSGTTYTFTIRATAGSETADREFSIYNAGTGTQTIYTANTTLNTTFPRPMKIYVIGGGGGGAGEQSEGSIGSAGGGGGGMAYKLLSTAPTGAYTITVGQGGAGGYQTSSSDPEHGQDGGTSSVTASGITTIQATGGSGGTDSDNGSSTDGVGGAGGVGSGGDINGTGGTGGRGTANSTGSTFRNGGDGGNGTNGGAGGGGGGTDSSSNNSYRGGNGGNGDTNYFTGGGGGGGCDGDGQNVNSNQTGSGGSGYSSGGKGGGQSSPAVNGSDTSGTSSNGSVGAVNGSRNNNGGGGGAFGGGGGGSGSADGGLISGASGGRGAVIIRM